MRRRIGSALLIGSENTRRKETRIEEANIDESAHGLILQVRFQRSSNVWRIMKGFREHKGSFSSYRFSSGQAHPLIQLCESHQLTNTASVTFPDESTDCEPTLYEVVNAGESIPSIW